ncbi:MAG: hypothetical protein RL302_148 [Pseudomonadota bacterium]|jgi:Protein of unknown function (DUF2726)
MIISFLIGMVMGATLLYWRNKVVKRESRRIPKEWPLKRRPLVNTAERRVWIWLAKIMFDQQILVKLPVTRFTAPADMQEATHWYQLLNGVYCTFTVCGMDGKVIGCVDVAGRRGLSMSNQTLKHGLLAQCGVHYWIVDPDNLPHLTQIRTAFLGERALRRPESDHLDSRFKNSADNLQAAVSRQRNSKLAKLDADLSDSSDFGESRLTSGWEQNSFVTPLDSRKAELR